MLVDIERDGKLYKAQVPNDAPKETWKYGVVVGPPDFEDVLPVELARRLHNELFARGLITHLDTIKRANDVSAAWQSALKYDVGQILASYTTS